MSTTKNSADNPPVTSKRRMVNVAKTVGTLILAFVTIAGYKWEHVTVLTPTTNTELPASESGPFEGSVEWVYVINFDEDEFKAQSGYDIVDDSNDVGFTVRPALETYWFWTTTLMLFVGTCVMQVKWAFRKKEKMSSKSFEFASKDTQRSLNSFVLRVMSPPYYALIVAELFYHEKSCIGSYCFTHYGDSSQIFGIAICYFVLLGISPCVNCWLCCRSSQGQCCKNWFVFWWFAGGVVCGMSCFVLNLINVSGYDVTPQLVFSYEVITGGLEAVYQLVAVGASVGAAAVRMESGRLGAI